MQNGVAMRQINPRVMKPALRIRADDGDEAEFRRPAVLLGQGEYIEHWPEQEPEVTAPRTLDHLREIHRWGVKDWVVVALIYGAIAGWLLGFAWLLGQLDFMRIVRWILSQG